jgi:RHS repeat-associated protein
MKQNLFRTAQFWRCLFILALTLMLGMPVHAYHFPWDQGHDTTDWNDPNDPGTCEGPNCDPCNSTGSPVYIPTGHFIWNETDIIMPGHPTLSLVRTYNSHDGRDGLFGNGWMVEGDIGLFKVNTSDANEYHLRLSNGKRYVYTLSTTRSGETSIVAPPGRFDRIVQRADDGLELVDVDGSRQLFNSNGDLITRIDANGNALNYSYATDTGLLIRIGDNHGRFLALTYTSAGRVASVSDHSGRIWSYNYDPNGNLVQVIDPMSGVTQYEYTPYTAAGDNYTYYHLTKITDPAGVVVTEVIYNGERVQSYTVGENLYTFNYNTSTKKVTKTDRLGSRWTYVYNDDGFTVQETNPLNHGQSFEFDSNGRMTKITDELNKVWLVNYDELGRKKSESDPLGNTIQFEYAGERPQPIKVISPAGHETVLAYDANGNMTLFKDPAGFETRMEWDANGRLVATQNPLGHRTEITSDALGRPQVVQDPLGRQTLFEYDAVGNLIKIQNYLGQAVRFEYDLLERRVKSIDPSGKATITTYDAAGRIKTIKDSAGKITTYNYDSYGRVVERIYPDGRSKGYQYRQDNLLSQIDYPSGSSVVINYDKAKRPISKTFGSLSFTYNYDARGQMTQASSAEGTITFRYDDAGLLVEETTSLGFSLTISRNQEGERTGISTTGYSASYSLDPRGLITQIDSTTGVYELNYDAAGRRTKLQLPNGATVEYFYDVANQITRIVHNGAFNASYTYDYDERGLITRWQGDSFNWQYEYDEDQSLTKATNGPQNFDYNYDLAGNRIDDGQVYDEVNRLTADNRYTYRYDLNGNLIQKVHKGTGAQTVYTWNSLNQLVQVEKYADDTVTTPDKVISYTYGPLGRRWSRTEDGVTERYVYDGSDRILTVEANGTLKTYVTFGPAVDEPLGAGGVDGRYFYHANHQGSIMALTDNVGSVITRYDYTPYGRTTETAAASANPFRYTGREYEADDLYYYRARYYDPTAGRFFSEDPIGFAAGDTNLYRYVGGNPVNFVDPSGNIAPLLIWAGIEIALAIYDAYDTASTILDPCAEAWEKWLAGGLFVAGALLPGGGYSKIDDISKAAVKGCCCFREGTLVATRKGLKPIERIAKGELLATWNEENGDTGWKPVSELYVTEGKSLYTLTLADTDGKKETVYVTDNHPYWVKDVGWLDSGKLEAGMEVKSQNKGWLTVASLLETDSSPVTYNLSVADHNTYLVGEHAAVVHNCACVRVLQSGGNKLTKRTAKGLNEHFGESFTKRDWGRALEGLKKDLGLRNDHHGRILGNGNYVDDAGNILGNMSHYLP